MTPPLDLTASGLYWDDARNRYFPISSKPKTVEPLLPAIPVPSDYTFDPPSSPTKSSHCNRRRRRLDPYAPSSRGILSTYAARSRHMHETLAHQIALTNQSTRIPVPALSYGRITTLKTAHAHGQTYNILGDARGWLYTHHWEPTSPRPAGTWLPELNLISGISSMCVSGDRCVATSSGPQCKIIVQELCAARTFVINLGQRTIHDIWASDLHDKTLVVGANKKAAYLEDIDTVHQFKTLNTNSDVFAVHLQERLVYAGARNGSIFRFDTRLPTDKLGGELLFADHLNPTTITHLQTVLDWQLLVAQMDGHLSTYDLRFLKCTKSNPVLEFPGHINSYIPQLPVTVDPNQDFVFAAGQDRRVRIWSLKSGRLLSPPDPADTAPSSPASTSSTATLAPATKATTAPQGLFNRTMESQIKSLQVVEEVGGNGVGLSLWVASETEVMKHDLGCPGVER